MCCQWKSWKSVHVLRAGCVCKSTRQSTATGKERKAWKKASEWASSAKPSGNAVGMSVLPHRDPCSSLKPVGNRSSNGYCNGSRKERKGTEEEIILEALLSLTRVFFLMESITISWFSYTTGAFSAPFRLQFGFVPMQFHMSLTRPWGLHSAAAWFWELPWLKFAICKAFLNFLPQVSPRLCAEVSYQTHTSFTVSQSYFAPTKGFSLALKLSWELWFSMDSQL